MEKDPKLQKNIKNLILTGLFTTAMLGLNYLGYKAGINTDVLAWQFAFTMLVSGILIPTNTQEIIKRRRKN